MFSVVGEPVHVARVHAGSLSPGLGRGSLEPPGGTHGGPCGGRAQGPPHPWGARPGVEVRAAGPSGTLSTVP